MYARILVIAAAVSLTMLAVPASTTTTAVAAVCPPGTYLVTATPHPL